MAEKALTEGIKHSETNGQLNKWITSVYFRNKSINNIRLYGDKAYLFANDVLITVLLIPKELLPAVNKISKRKGGKTLTLYKYCLLMEGKYMLFNEKEMLELCKRYDIEVMNNDDKDYYKDTEFSMSDIMKEPYVHTAVEKCIASQSIEIPIIIEEGKIIINTKATAYRTLVTLAV